MRISLKIMGVKNTISYILAVTIISFIVFLSCKKEKSCEGCNEANRPPVAIAGSDLVIVLPTDSITIDGSASNDPDGTITEWIWKKISGPVSFRIVNNTSAKTRVSNLDTGLYRFELTVKDDGGVSAKDTVQVTVNAQPQANRPPVANAGIDQIITLPVNEVFVDGGRSTDPDNNIAGYLWTKISGRTSYIVENPNALQTRISNLVQGIYLFELKVTDSGGLFSKDTLLVDVQTPAQSSCLPLERTQVKARLVPFVTLSYEPYAVTSTNNKLIFVGPVRMDIYDLTLNTWLKVDLQLSPVIYLPSIAVIGAGNKVFFAGGEDGAVLTKTVHIYDISSNTWSISYLSRAGDSFSTATCGNKVFFTGGNQGIYVTNIVDIYDLTTNSWSTATLSSPRNVITSMSSRNKVYFSGGDPWSGQLHDAIDIYDNVSNSWSVLKMQNSRAYHAGVVVNDIIYVAGGVTQNHAHAQCSVETLNTITGEGSSMNLFGPAVWHANNGQNAVVKNNQIIFLRHDGGVNSNRFDIYDISDNAWSIGLLPQILPSSAKTITVNNTIYIAGGLDNKQVWKLEY